MYRLLKKMKDTTRSQALRISAIYLLVGVVWILLSDKVIEWFIPDPHDLILASLFKGWFYVLSSAWLIYLLVHAATRQTAHSNLQLSKANQRCS